jgi:hypothetical protein
MKFNFDFTLTGLDGLPLTDEQGTELHAGRTAATLIMRSPDPGTDTMMKYDWATQLYKNGNIDLDKAGQVQFKSLFEKMPGIYLSVRGQIMEVLDKRQQELKAD